MGDSMIIDAIPSMHDQARQRLQSAHAFLSQATQELMAASQLVESAYATGQRAAVEREAMLVAIDTELGTLPSEQTIISNVLTALTDLRNRSKMVAPIYLLPSEILARIFCDAACHCTRSFDYNFLGSDTANPTALLGVCRQWRQIATNHRPLWTHLDLAVSRRDVYEYPPSDLWTEHLQGAPIFANVRQYRTFKNEDEDFDDFSDDDERNPAEMITNLLDFLTPFMTQICSLNLNLGWPKQYILTKILDHWQTHGAYTMAKVLKVESNQEISALEFHPSSVGFWHTNTGYKRFFGSLEVLHLCNVVPDWLHMSLQNLTELYLESGEDWSMTNFQLASGIASCPRLQRLALDCFITKEGSLSTGSVTLNELQELSLRGVAHACVVETALTIIDAGKKPITLNVAMPFGSSKTSPARAAFYSFFSRANVKTLRISNMEYQDEFFFASQLAPLFNVEVLVLSSCHLSELVMIEGDRVSGKHTTIHRNPQPVGPSMVLWPSVRDLYLTGCVVDQAHASQLLSVHSIQTIRMFHCSRQSDPRQRWYALPKAPEEYFNFLREIIPEVVYPRTAPWTWFLP